MLQVKITKQSPPDTTQWFINWDAAVEYMREYNHDKVHPHRIICIESMPKKPIIEKHKTLLLDAGKLIIMCWVWLVGVLSISVGVEYLVTNIPYGFEIGVFLTSLIVVIACSLDIYDTQETFKE